MIAGRIAGATHTLGKPSDWKDDEQGPCGSLTIRAEETSAGIGLTSAWHPTADELARPQAGAPIYLTIIGTSHPPVSLQVGQVPE